MSAHEDVDDFLLVWMALVTERERVTALVTARCDTAGRPMPDEKVEDMQRSVTRLNELAKMAHERRVQIAEVFKGKPMTEEERIEHLRRGGSL